MIFRLKLFIFLLVSIIITACSKQPVSEPSCRVNASAASNHQGAGACIVRINGKLLVTQLNSGLYDLPTGHNISSSQNISKSSQCLAHQSMWQQTGLNVEVLKVIGAQADGTWLFGCKLEAGFDGSESPFDAPPWSNDEIKTVLFINPFDIDLHNWARRDHLEIVRDAYVLQGSYQNAK